MATWKTSFHYEPRKEADEIRPDLQPLSSVASTYAAFMQNHSSALLLPVAMRSLIAPLPFSLRSFRAGLVST